MTTTFQLYWSKDPDFNASLLERAERAGYTALVVTLDTFCLGWRVEDMQIIGLAQHTFQADSSRTGFQVTPADHAWACGRRISILLGLFRLFWFRSLPL